MAAAADLSVLTDRQRQAYELRKQSVPLVEAARQMGCSASRVGELAQRAEAKLTGKPLRKKKSNPRQIPEKGAGRKAIMSKLKCNECGEPITQWALQQW